MNNLEHWPFRMYSQLVTGSSLVLVFPLADVVNIWLYIMRAY